MTSYRVNIYILFYIYVYIIKYVTASNIEMYAHYNERVFYLFFFFLNLV